MKTKPSILKYTLLSSQGDASQTIDAIKNNKIMINSKRVKTFDEEINFAYFSLQEELEENHKSIYNSLRTMVQTLLEDLDETQKKQTAIVIGTSLLDINIVESIIDTIYSDTQYSSKKSSIDSYAKELSREFGLNEYSMTISTACTSSVNALLEASNLIKSGIFDNVVVLGVEIYSQTMFNGFGAMKLLSEGKQKPFDKQRDGLVLGEGLAGLLLSSEKSPWSLDGGYSNCNSINITAVSESGDEFSEVMQSALDVCGVKADELRAIKVHATSSISNDLSEIKAISKLFPSTVALTALKPYIGHTLGACGVLELVLFMSCIDDGFIPKSINHKDSIIDEYALLQKHSTCRDGKFMLNYFGFGGNNTSIVVTKELAR